MSDHDDFTPDDQLAALRAAIDQMVMLAPEFARSAKGMWDAFVAEGFSESQALYLTAVQIKDSPGTPP